MNSNNKKLPWYAIFGGLGILVLHLVIAIFSSLRWFDWLSIISVLAGLFFVFVDKNHDKS